MTTLKYRTVEQYVRKYFFPLKNWVQNWVQFYKKKIEKKKQLYLTKLRENMHNEKLKLATLKWLNTPSNDVSNQ